ncbi:hypothetical protein Fleli_0165 [Bernardetia litoralis DSM 6794]|uniref:Uncharacterized protein n=1 Tax=Bernardetia litoralis (strain ATCC 23117 / DSM 6794 / NBRC 15988 / NCIMB 1366 / Fx l1 / Sio-4) TaxID=880071 RepID=I4AFC9_BERLS|nr:hypothetical protein [Bernardetia litoralis]AFM02664.1 hypothetical protein Fleli_0165 [Bernardetia litoralis DSM 6794]
MLDNSSTYEIELIEIEEVNLNYLIRTVSGDITYFEGYTFLDVSTQEVLTFHKYLSSYNSRSSSKVSLGTLKTTMDCVDGFQPYTYSIFSDYSSFHNSFYRNDPSELKVYSESDEAMLLLSNGYRISNPQDFSYKIINLKARQNQDFSCQDASFINGREIMKSIEIKAAEAKTIETGDANKAIEIYAFPINQTITNYNTNPYLLNSTGLIERRTLATFYLDDYKVWYPTIWIEDKREHMEVVVDIIKEEANEVEHYIQKSYGNYPPPTNMNFEIPSTNTQVRHRGSTSTIFQSGEHYLLQIEYKKRNFNPSDIQIYTWKLNIDSKKNELEWTIPSFSQQAADYLSLDKDFYRNNTIPTMSYFEVEEGVNYDSYTNTYFTSSNPFTFKDMEEWKTTWFTRKSL